MAGRCTEYARGDHQGMQRHGVLVRKPQANALRINSGTKEENAACVKTLEAALKELV